MNSAATSTNSVKCSIASNSDYFQGCPVFVLKEPATSGRVHCHTFPPLGHLNSLPPTGFWRSTSSLLTQGPLITADHCRANILTTYTDQSPPFTKCWREGGMKLIVPSSGFSHAAPAGCHAPTSRGSPVTHGSSAIPQLSLSIYTLSLHITTGSHVSQPSYRLQRFPLFQLSFYWKLPSPHQ